MITSRSALSIFGRAAVALSMAAGGTLLTAAPALASAPMAVHGAYGDDPYGDDPQVVGAQSPYDTTTTTLAPTTTTTTAAPVAAPVADPVVDGAGIEAPTAVAVAPAEAPAETAPVSLDTLPRTGNPARTQALFALVLVGFGSVLRAATRRHRVKA